MEQMWLALLAGAGVGWVVRDILGRMKMDPKGVSAALSQAAQWVEETKAAHQQALASLAEAHQQQLVNHVSWSDRLLQAVIAAKGTVPADQPPQSAPAPPEERPELSAMAAGIAARQEAERKKYVDQLVRSGFSADDANAIINGQDIDAPLALVDRELDRATVRATKVT